MPQIQSCKLVIVNVRMVDCEQPHLWRVWCELEKVAADNVNAFFLVSKDAVANATFVIKVNIEDFPAAAYLSFLSCWLPLMVTIL